MDKPHRAISNMRRVNIWGTGSILRYINHLESVISQQSQAQQKNQPDQTNECPVCGIKPCDHFRDCTVINN